MSLCEKFNFLDILVVPFLIFRKRNDKAAHSEAHRQQVVFQAPEDHKPTAIPDEYAAIRLAHARAKALGPGTKQTAIVEDGSDRFAEVEYRYANPDVWRVTIRTAMRWVEAGDASYYDGGGAQKIWLGLPEADCIVGQRKERYMGSLTPSVPISHNSRVGIIKQTTAEDRSMKPTELEARKRALKKAEAHGTVYDSMTVRVALMNRVRSGEITLLEAQEEIARLKIQARKDGQLTRNDFFRD